MQSDVRMIPATAGEVKFAVRGASRDSGLMLLQRIYVLLLSDGSLGYRQGGGRYSLLKFLEGGNMPDDVIMNNILNICCADALSELDQDDRDLVSSLTASSTGGSVAFTLTLTDGTVVTGAV